MPQRYAAGMRLLMILACLVVALTATTAAHARQAVIHRCIDAHGQQIFTDRSCADMQATPVLPPATAPGATAPGVTVIPGVSPAAPPVDPRFCADSVDLLRQQIVDAFATRDANRLAGLVLWNGYGRQSVIGQIRTLSKLMQHPLIDVDDGSASAPPPALPGLYDASQPLTQILTPAASLPAPAERLVLVTGADGGEGGTRETTFGLARQSGCVWLLPPG